MRLDQMSGYVAFLTVARRGSFTAAGAELNVSPSAISQSLSQLEERLGVRLFDRTTRSVQLTDAGRRFLDRAGPAADELSRAAEGLADLSKKPAGRLRVTAARYGYNVVLGPKIGAFLKAFPEIELDVQLEEELVDIVREGYDCGLRLGENVEKDMVAVAATPEIQTAVVGAPKYFKKFPPPRTLDDLKRHECISFRYGDGSIYRWEFDRDGREITVETSGRFIVTDPVSAMQAAIDGVGLAYGFDVYVRDWIKSGKLQRVLVPYCPRYPGFYFYYPHRKLISAKLRAFIDFFKL